MRRLLVKAKNDPTEIAGLVFFAQCLDELLFDHSDDSYKAPALNTLSRTLEFRRLAALNDEAAIGPAALEAFVEELDWSIREDAIIDAQQRELCLHHVGVIKSNLSTPDRLERSLAAIRLALGDYFGDCMRILRELVLTKASERRRIVALASTFVAQTEIEGFSRRFCYHMKQRVVRRLQSAVVLDPSAVLEGFFKSFTGERKRWRVILSASAEVERFAAATKSFDFEVTPLEKLDLSQSSEAHKIFLGSCEPNCRAIVFSDMPAREPIYARDRAKAIFDFFQSAIGFQYHELRLRVGDLGHVSESDGRAGINVGTGPDPMHRNKRAPDQPNFRQIEELAEMMFGKHLTDQSARRFANALGLHQAALRSPVEHNQLVDLWAAIEGLLPPPGKDSPRIRFFVANLVAPLTLTYAEKLFERASQEIVVMEDELVDATLRRIDEGKSTLEKTVRLVSCSEYEHERNELAKHLAVANPLLLFRLWELSEKFKSAKHIRQTLLSHRKKVTWHIERIYSTRNSIMHSAEALPYLGTLVENLHGYVDLLLSSIARVAVRSDTRISIATVLEHILGHESQLLGKLEAASRSEDGTRVTNENWLMLIFGERNPLGPSLH